MLLTAALLGRQTTRHRVLPFTPQRSVVTRAPEAIELRHCGAPSHLANPHSKFGESREQHTVMRWWSFTASRTPNSHFNVNCIQTHLLPGIRRVITAIQKRNLKISAHQAFRKNKQVPSNSDLHLCIKVHTYIHTTRNQIYTNHNREGSQLNQPTNFFPHCSSLNSFPCFKTHPWALYRLL